jgi:hypothetical protein
MEPTCLVAAVHQGSLPRRRPDVARRHGGDAPNVSRAVMQNETAGRDLGR